MAIEVDGKTLETTDTGYLINLEDWNERVAQVIADQEGIALTPKHMDVVNYLRDQYFNHNGNCPNMRTMVKDMQDVWTGEKVDTKSLYDLFPGNPSKQAGRIAGVPESKRKGGY